MPFSTISQWTGEFKKEIGKGAFGTVYEGLVVFPEGQSERLGYRVAVKKVNADGIIASLAIESAEIEDNTYIRAIQREIKVLSSFHHENVIRLVAYCLPSYEELKNSKHKLKELCLVYVLAPLGGLNAILRDTKKRTELVWPYRIKIAIGVAKGLCFLHNNFPGNPAYHKDIKAANIAIMADYTPKIMYLTMSKYVPDFAVEGMVQHSLTTARLGTPGYMCPHFMCTMKYDAKCEVYSYGILLLELLSGCLQGYEDENGQQTYLDETALTADARIEWPAGCAEEMFQLAGDCFAKHSVRIGSMTTVMRRLVEINKKYHKQTLYEDHLLHVNKTLMDKLQALQLQQDIKSIQEVEQTNKCEICFDDKVPASKGVFCSNTQNPHFICGPERNDCFSDMVSSQANDDGSFVRNGRAVICAYCIASVQRTVSKFNVSTIGRQTNGVALAAFLSACDQVQLNEYSVKVEELGRNYEDKLQKLKIQCIEDENARRKASTDRHRLRIIEGIVNLKCPHCDITIFDFNGCYAVHHKEDHVGKYRQGCGLYFCGWCLEKFDTNVGCHTHVKACPSNLNPGTYNGSYPEDFNRVHGPRRCTLVQKYLQENVVDATEREEIKKSLRRYLKDLGINI